MATAGTAVFDRLSSDPRVWQFAFHAVRDIPEMLIAGRERPYLQHFFTARSADPSAVTSNRAAARAYLTPESIKAQYLYGVTDPTLVDPDTWLVDSTLLQRPGVDEIMLDLLLDIKNNKPTFSAMQRLLIDQHAPVMVATGANDEIFPEPVVRTLLRDLPDTEHHSLNTGHFALEDHAREIADLVRDFLDGALRPVDA